MNQKTIRLEQCCECITDGDHLPPPKADSGIPFITISNVDAYNQIDFSNSMYVPEQYYDALKSIRKVQKNDILYSVVGSFGVPVLIKDDKKFCFQRHIALLRPNDKIDCRFLYYVMKSPSFYAQADTVALGAAQRTISLSSLRSMTIQIPEIDVQRRIADILSAYDDLIENDRKQIKLLEEAAQRLYKEWFVDLRFPGWETTPIVDGLPEGWEQYKFSDVVDIMSGGTPKTENKGYYNGTIPFYTPKDSDGSVFAFLTQKTLTEEGLNSCNSPLFPQNTIIITARGTVGKTTILARPMAMNQSCYALKSDAIASFGYLFYSLNKEISRLKSMANGGVFDTIIVKTFDNINIIKPTDAVLASFDFWIMPILESIKVKCMENFKLASARDALLPKLMSGEIEV